MTRNHPDLPFGIRELYEKYSAGGSAAIKSSCKAT